MFGSIYPRPPFFPVQITHVNISIDIKITGFTHYMTGKQKDVLSSNGSGNNGLSMSISDWTRVKRGTDLSFRIKSI